MAGESKISIYGAIVANTLIAVSKFIAAIFTGSSAMLAEGIHSVIDTGNGFLLLLGLNQAEKKADDLHPFGYGKEEYFWSFVVSIMIFALGGGFAIYEGVQSILAPTEISDPLWNYIVIAAAIVFEGISLIIAIRHFRTIRPHGGLFGNMIKSKNPASFAVIVEDSAAVAGLLLALAGIYFSHHFNEPLYDSIASLLIGLLLLLVAAFLARETKGLLIGETAGEEILSEINHLLSTTEGIENWQAPKTLHLGPKTILVIIEVTFNKNLSVRELKQVILQFKQQASVRIPRIKYLYIQPSLNMVEIEN